MLAECVWEHSPRACSRGGSENTHSIDGALTRERKGDHVDDIDQVGVPQPVVSLIFASGLFLEARRDRYHDACPIIEWQRLVRRTRPS